MIFLAAFSFLLIDFIDINSFRGMDGASVPQKYQQIIYFSTITLTTIGYGDITPATDSARLLAGFWGVMSQFYMVAVVGIIIAKFTSKQ
jgi:voltage-gated potassium channel